MARIASIFLLCLFSFSAIAQSDVTISFAGVPLKKDANTMQVSTATKSPKITTDNPLYKPSCYASYLPKKGDLVGPLKMNSGENLHPNIIRSIEQSGGGKLFFDEVRSETSTGTITKHNSFVIRLTQ